MAYDLGHVDQDDRLDLAGDEGYEAPPPRRRWVPRILTGLVMVAFAGGLWFAYVEGQRHPASENGGAKAPLIRADKAPMRVKPAQPGGMQVPDQNKLIYNETPGGPAIEKLLPPPEQPLQRPLPPAAPAPAAPAMQAPAPAASPAPAAAPAPAAPELSRPPHAIAPTVVAPSAISRLAPPPIRKAIRDHAPAPAVAAAGGLRIQLGAMRSPDLARREWYRLKRLNPDLLGRVGAVAVRVDLGAKGVFYRIEAGPFATQAAADRTCGALQRRRFGCVLVR